MLAVKRAKGLNLKGKNGEDIWQLGVENQLFNLKFQAPMMHSWQSHWEKKSFKLQWKKSPLIPLTGANSVNCEFILLLQKCHVSVRTAASLCCQVHPLAGEHGRHPAHGPPQKLPWRGWVPWTSQSSTQRLWCLWETKIKDFPFKM